MTLVAGTKLGPYDVIGAIGAGGMGEVYRARDTRLGRDVALKVLPEAFASDSERIARFEREAKVLASLNHPNIAAIYGFEGSGTLQSLVMELVEGPHLAERIKPGAIPIDEALPIAKQICEALEYAHERGIVHRDLKPANIKLDSNNSVKILDFGLAKALESDAASADISSSPTITRMATQAGIILGTAAYMSPEQAKGKAADRRTDIWAFGCVFYEMLTGRMAFSGETVTDTLAAVIMREPDWGALPANIPQAVGNLLRRCLKKDPRQRLQSIAEARIALEDTLTGVLQEVAPAAQPRAQAGHRPWLAWVVAGSLILVAGVATGWWARARQSTPNLDWSAQRLGGPNIALAPRISPDGHTLAFQAMVDGLTQVAVMDTDSRDWTVLTKDRSRGYVAELNWSPDGSKIYFDRGISVPNGIYAISRFGGEEHLVLEDAIGPEVLPDGTLLAVKLNKDRKEQLYRYWPESGRLEALDATFSGNSDLCPPVRAFHDGKDAVFFGETFEQGASDASAHLYMISLASGRTQRLAPELDFRMLSALFLFPLAVTSDDQSVLAEVDPGDLHRVISIPRRGAGSIRTLFTLTLPPAFMDMDKNGNLYLDQADRPMEVLRFSSAGGTPEVLEGPASSLTGQYQTISLPDGRVVFGSWLAGRSRLVAARPGAEAVPLIETKEETSSPACRVGKDEIAFLLGPPDHAVVAVASVSDGRVVARLGGIPASEVSSLAASPGGKTLYYVAAKTVWAISAAGGQPRRIGPGDAVAPDPNGKDLVVQLTEKSGVRLLRVPASGGTAEAIPIHGDLRLASSDIAPNAVASDGRIVVSIISRDSWFYGAGILDPRTGRLDRIPVNIPGDPLAPGWLDDGRILSSAWPFKSALWRFHPVGSERK